MRPSTSERNRSKPSGSIATRSPTSDSNGVGSPTSASSSSTASIRTTQSTAIGSSGSLAPRRTGGDVVGTHTVRRIEEREVVTTGPKGGGVHLDEIPDGAGVDDLEVAGPTGGRDRRAAEDGSRRRASPLMTTDRNGGGVVAVTLPRPGHGRRCRRSSGERTDTSWRGVRLGPRIRRKKSPIGAPGCTAGVRSIVNCSVYSAVVSRASTCCQPVPANKRSRPSGEKNRRWVSSSSPTGVMSQWPSISRVVMSRWVMFGMLTSRLQAGWDSATPRASRPPNGAR